LGVGASACLPQAGSNKNAPKQLHSSVV
jgi:hypothetical protein